MVQDVVARPQIFALYFLGMLVVSVITMSLALWAHRRRAASGAVAFFWTMVLLTVWSIADALAVASSGPAWTLAWIRVQLTAIAIMPVPWLLLAMDFTLRRLRSRPALIALLGIVPLITTLLVWTDSLHGLVMRQVQFPAIGPFTTLVLQERGPWYWVHTTYSYALLIAGSAAMIRAAGRSTRLYRSQVSLLALGTVIGLVISIASVFYVAPTYHLDITPIGFAIAAGAFMRASLRHRLFDLVPVAQSTLIDRMADAMLALDHRLLVVELNPAAARFAGRPAEALIGHPVSEVLANCPGLLAILSELTATSTSLEADLICKHHEYEVRIDALGDQAPGNTGWLIVTHDITARAAVQRELQLRNEDLDDFARTVAHDLKTPLTLITGYAELLAEAAEDPSPQELARFATIIRDRAMAMSSIVDNLLLMASTRQLDVPLLPLDMAQIVECARARLAPIIEKSGAEITVPAAWPPALGHAPWIEEVWVNYLSNAIKYGGQPPRIELGASHANGDGSAVRFWVRDNGAGIAPADQERLFAPFTRLRGTSSEGHGLGLSIVRRIVQRMGGEVSVASAGCPGEGSTFGFTLHVDPQRPG